MRQQHPSATAHKQRETGLSRMVQLAQRAQRRPHVPVANNKVDYITGANTQTGAHTGHNKQHRCATTRIARLDSQPAKVTMGGSRHCCSGRTWGGDTGHKLAHAGSSSSVTHETTTHASHRAHATGQIRHSRCATTTRATETNTCKRCTPTRSRRPSFQRCRTAAQRWEPRGSGGGQAHRKVRACPPRGRSS